MKKQPDIYKGVFAILCSAFFFSLMAVFVRLSGDIPSVQKSFFRNAVAFIFAAVILIKNKPPVSIDKEKVMALILRSLFGTVGIIMNFYATDQLLLSDATMLNKLSPFFAIIFSYFILKEKVNLIRIIAVIVAFIGSLFIIKPGGEELLSAGAFAGLLGGICAGAAYTYVRLLGKKNVPGAFIVFFFSAFSCIATLPSLIFDFTPMSSLQILFLFLAGLSATGGQFSITAAYSYAPAGEISVYDYFQVIFAAVFGFFLFGQVPDLYSIIGYVIICSVSVLMFLYNKRDKRDA